MLNSYKPDNAVLEWDDRGLPYSSRYGDVYYSRADALGESSHVFLQGNALPDRFAAAASGQFTIAELGFGAGVNFLNTCRLWCSHAPAGARLHYLSCELHPLTAGDLHRLLSLFPELADYGQALLSQYCDHTCGTHQMEFTFGEHSVTLTLLLGEALEMLQAHATRQPFTSDAWFLDGFAPKTNPDMWQQALIGQIAALSHPGTTLATYSVAGSFRANLEQAGFSWEKRPGFAGKKHMLCARLKTPARKQPASSGPKTVCIIGAGLAGCSTAWMLARSGWQVSLIDKEATVAALASGNPQGVLHFKPATVDSPDNRFNLHAYLYATRFYRQLGLPETVFSGCGMLQLAHDEKMTRRFVKLAQSGLYAEQVFRVLDCAEASQLAGMEINHSALYFPESGWLSPLQLCHHYCRHPAIKLVCEQEVGMIDRGASGWEIVMHSQQGEQFMHTAHLILCNSADIHRFQQTRHLPLISNRGQVDVYQASEQTQPGMVICGQGYVIPGSEGQQCVGGSFFIEAETEERQRHNSQWHLQQVAGINAGLAQALSAQQPLQQRVSNRCTLPDRMPLAGAVDPDSLPGLWINTGHGSHGLARTPVCAALLASELNNTPSPLCPSTAAVLSPQRYSS